LASFTVSLSRAIMPRMADTARWAVPLKQITKSSA
jgi:hypothetical protein